MTIRPAREQDWPGIGAVVRDAFDDGGEVADLVVGLRTSGAIEVELVAIDDGDAVVGHVALERGWVDAEEALLDVLVLSPLSVAPSRQRRGIGTGLIQAALEAARERVEPYVFLEGSPDYYGQRGFEPAGSRGFRRPSERIPGPAFQVAVLEDQGATGRLVYPDAFWRHDMVGLRGEVLAALRKRFGE